MKDNNKQVKILIVDDEEDVLEILEYNLLKEGYQVKTAKDGKDALKKAEKMSPDLIILDIMMPGMDGIEVCSYLRDDPKFDDTLIAFLTARDESFTQVSALDSGGDDFINKPIKPNVLKSRVKALLRRHGRGKKGEKELNLLKFGDLRIDLDEFKVTYKKKKIKLAKKEYQLLTLLTSKPGKVFTRQEILNHVWGTDVIVGDRTIDVHIRKLREKIGSDYIQTFKGIGYKFEF